MATADRIELRGLALSAVVGVLPEERLGPQPLEVDLDLYLDLSAAGASDDLADTVDYGEVCETVRRLVSSSEPLLLERLAMATADAVLALDARIGSVTMVVRKLRPPVSSLGSSGVRVTRSR